MNNVKRQFNDLEYRPLCAEQYDDYYHLKCDPMNIAWSGHLKEPNYGSFRAHFETFLNSKDKCLALFYHQDQCIGYAVLRFLADGVCDTSLGVHSDFSGQGFARIVRLKMIEIASDYGCKSMQSYISDKNIASWRSALRVGYTKTDVMEIRDLPLVPGIHHFYKYVREI